MSDKILYHFCLIPFHTPHIWCFCISCQPQVSLPSRADLTVLTAASCKHLPCNSLSTLPRKAFCFAPLPLLVKYFKPAEGVTEWNATQGVQGFGVQPDAHLKMTTLSSHLRKEQYLWGYSVQLWDFELAGHGKALLQVKDKLRTGWTAASLHGWVPSAGWPCSPLRSLWCRINNPFWPQNKARGWKFYFEG